MDEFNLQRLDELNNFWGLDGHEKSCSLASTDGYRHSYQDKDHSFLTTHRSIHGVENLRSTYHVIIGQDVIQVWMMYKHTNLIIRSHHDVIFPYFFQMRNDLIGNLEKIPNLQKDTTVTAAAHSPPNIWGFAP